MGLEVLEARCLFTAQLLTTLDFSEFAGVGVVGQSVGGRIRLTVTNAGDQAVPRGTPRVTLDLSVRHQYGAEGQAVIPDLSIQDIRRVSFAGLKAGKSRVFNLTVKVPKNAPEAVYYLDVDVSEAERAALDKAGVQQGLRVQQNASVRTVKQQYSFTAITLDSSQNGQGILTLRNNRSVTVSGNLEVVVGAAIAGQRSLSLLTLGGLPEEPVGASEVGRFKLPLRRLKPGQSMSFPVQLELPARYGVPVSYELYADVRPSRKYAPSTSTAPVITTVRQGDAISTGAPTVATNPVLAEAFAARTDLTGPVYYQIFRTARPSIGFEVGVGVFSDSDGRQGVFEYSTSFGSTTPPSVTITRTTSESELGVKLVATEVRPDPNDPDRVLVTVQNSGWLALSGSRNLNVYASVAGMESLGEGWRTEIPITVSGELAAGGSQELSVPHGIAKRSIPITYSLHPSTPTESDSLVLVTIPRDPTLALRLEPMTLVSDGLTGPVYSEDFSPLTNVPPDGRFGVLRDGLGQQYAFSVGYTAAPRPQYIANLIRMPSPGPLIVVTPEP